MSRPVPDASFAWDEACNPKNLRLLRALGRRLPASISTAICLRTQPTRIQLCSTARVFVPCPSTAITSLQLESCTSDLLAFEQLLTAARHRNKEGLLTFGGTTYTGYADYDSVAGTHVATVQATRNVILSTVADAVKFVSEAPGLRGIFDAVLRALGAPDANWNKVLRRFNALVQDESSQTDFAWHCDTEELSRLKRDTLTVVVQCSEAITAMRIFGGEPFYYRRRGDTAMFPGLACHQSIPRRRDLLKTVVKAVFFLQPDVSTSHAANWPICGPWRVPSLPEPTHTVVSCNLSMQVSGSTSPIPPPRKEAPELLCDCLLLVLDRRDAEFVDAGRPILEPAPSCDPSHLPYALSQTFMERSALGSIWNALCLAHREACQAPLRLHWDSFDTCTFMDHFTLIGKDHFFVQTENSGCLGSRVTGLVWYACHHAGRRDTGFSHASMMGIVARKGYGTRLHDSFCLFMKRQGATHLEAPMAICKLKRGAWLQSLGWDRDVVARTLRCDDGETLRHNLT
jgi:hypothetical protein